MLVRKGGIFTNINPSEYGIYLTKGFVKVINEPQVEVKQSEKEVMPEIDNIEEEIVPEVIEEEPVVETKPKNKRNKNK